MGVRDAKANLSQVLREVKAGREITITEYGRPVARVVPAGPPSLEERIAEMEARGEIAVAQRSKVGLHPLSIPAGLAQKYLQEGRE
jgi:prevent-host-death family protein